MNHSKQNPNRFIGFLFIALFVLGACSSSSRSKKPTTDASSDIATDMNLPPDPGEAGMETVAGIDSDTDGVRDDIQRYIALTYPDQPEVQRALKQYAKADQDYLLTGDDPVKARENALKVGDAIDCLFFKSPENASKIFRKMHAESLNTKERILANDKMDSLLSGQVFPTAKIGEEAKSCDDYEEAK